MQNRYPGTCSICRRPVAVGAGDYNTTTRSVTCQACTTPRASSTPKVAVTRSGKDIKFVLASFLGGELFAKYRDAISGAKFEPSDKSNIAPSDKALGIVSKLTAAGFLVDVPPDIAGSLQATRAEQQSLILTASERAGEVDAKLRERGLALFPFQRVGIKWLASRTGALLADEMGLGKTIQAVVAIPEKAPTLVICPAVAKGVWAREISRWRPDLTPVVLSGKNSFRWPVPGEVVIMNYDILPVVSNDPDKPSELAGMPSPATVLVGDEAHAIKGSRTKRTTSFREIAKLVFEGKGRVWLITGTPLLNRPPELWNLLQAANIAREAFGSWNQFVSAFGGTPGEWGGYEWGTPGKNVVEKLRRVSLRRERVAVLPELPEKIWRVVPVEITKATRLHVDKATKVLTSLMPTAWARLLSDEDEIGKDVGANSDLMSAVEEARRWIEASTSTNFEAMSHGRSLLAKAKIPSLIEMVEDFEEQDEPVLVFSAFRDPIDMFATRPGWAVITGDTSAADRTRIEDEFQAGQLKGVAGTIRAMGVAITLTRAHHAIFVDREFTPGLNDQAEDRVCRIGQTRGVVIHDLVTNHPLDKLLFEILGKKGMIIEKSVENASVTDDVDPVQLPEVDFQALAKQAEEEAKLVEKAEQLARERRALVDSERLSYETELETAKREGRVMSEVFLTPGRRGPRDALEVWALGALITLNQLDPDRAGTRNDVGWNGSDTGYGHHLGSRLFTGLTDKEWAVSIAMCTKYWRQVGRPPAS